MPKGPSSSLLRANRFSQPGLAYLITTCTQDRSPVFSNFHYGRLLVNELRQTEESGLAKSLAWVVMPDHLHWLLVLQQGSLPQLLRQIKGRSAAALNKHAGYRLLCWQPGYHDRAIRNEQELLSLARYTIANPLRADLVQRVGDYPLWDAVWLLDENALSI